MNNSIKTIITTLLLSQATFASCDDLGKTECDGDNDCTWKNDQCEKISIAKNIKALTSVNTSED